MIVHSRVMERSLMPWIICSQMVPILALAPIFIVVLGALGALYGKIPHAGRHDRIVVRPFPGALSQADRAAVYRRHREDLLGQSSVAIFVAGNRLGGDGHAELSPGVREEFELCKQLGRFAVPIGATGFVAKEIWDEVRRTNATFGGLDVAAQMAVLGDQAASDDAIVGAVLDIVRRASGTLGNTAVARPI